MTIFSPKGEFIRIVRLDELAGRFVEIIGAFGDGSVAIAPLELKVPEVGFAPNTATISRFWLDGRSKDSLGTFVWREVGLLSGEDQVGSRTFAPRTAAVARADRLWVGTAAEPSIEVHDQQGKLIRLIRWDAGDRAVGPADALAQFDGNPPEQRRIYASRPVMDRFPAHARLLVDPSGFLWVETYRRPTATGSAEWLVFDREGIVLARARIPAGLRVFEINDDFVIGVSRDADDVERVTLHALRRP
jgi:hypothetical protein